MVAAWGLVATAAGQEWTIEDPNRPAVERPLAVVDPRDADDLSRPSLEPVVPPRLGPDLVAWSVDLDDDCIVAVTLRNHGGLLAPGDATYRLFVDSQLVEERLLADLPDQGYADPMGRTRHRTEVRLGGANRRLALIVDPDDRLAELREDQNSAYRTASCGLAHAPVDLAVADLSAAHFGRIQPPLRIAVENRGDATLRSGTLVRFHGTLGGRRMRSFDAEIGPLGGGQRVWITAPAGWEVPYGALAEVTLEALSRGTDFDATNDRRRERLPVAFADYDALLADPVIGGAVVWFDGAVRVPYAQWTSAQRAELRQAIVRRESGDPPLPGRPPAIQSVDGYGSTFDRDEAWQVFLAFVAHGLWLEVHQVVPWSLHGLTGPELRLLFDATLLFTPTGRAEVGAWPFPADEVSFRAGPGSLGVLSVWNPAIAHEFVANSGLLAATPEETLYAVTRWMQGRLNHTQSWHGDHQGGWGPEDRLAEWGYAGLPLGDTVLYPLPGRSHRIEGCGANTGLYSFLLRSLNIPVELEWVTLQWPDGGGGHRRPIFPSLGKTMSHGDDPYEWWLEPLLAPVSVEELFHDFPQVSDSAERYYGPFYPLLDAHGVDCAGGVCNSDSEQTTYLRTRHLLATSFAYGTGFLDDVFVRHGEPGLRGTLTGPFVAPYFGGAEQDSMVAAVEQRVRDLGGGDLERGREELERRRALYRRTHDTAAHLRCCGTRLGGRVLFDSQGTGGVDWSWGTPGVEVVLYEVGADGVLGGGDDREVGRAVTDGLGSFRIGSLEEGTYVADVVDATAPAGAALDPDWQQDPSAPRTVGFGAVREDLIFVYRPAP